MQRISKIYIIMLSVCQLVLCSCATILLNHIGISDKKVSTRFITSDEKQIVFIPMHHIGKKEFYRNVRHMADSFLAMDYQIFFETVRKEGLRDSSHKDTIYRKVRKLLGVDFVTIANNGGYIDTVNNKIFGKKLKYISKHDLINQPRGLLLNLDSQRVNNVDADIVELISASEEKYSPIILEKYDFETPFGQKYKPDIKKEMKNYFLLEYRNKIVSDAVLNSPYKKILIVYGAKHFEGILQNLQKANKSYKEVSKF